MLEASKSDSDDQEQALPAALPSQKQALAIKIDAHRVEAVMDMVGELVVIKSQIAEGLNGLDLDPRIRALVAQLDKSVRELHERTLSMRMVSLRTTFIKLQRAVQDVGQKLGKLVQLEVHGEDTEIDRVMVERIADPLMHLCRNAVDHGIEPEAERIKASKASIAQIYLSAFRKGESVIIEIRDDGRGINRAAVVRKALEKGLLSAEASSDKLSDREIFGFILLPGFSTTENVNDISGRGVGLDVVKSNITTLGGSIEIQSKEGEGCMFRLSLPLTTAITDGIIVTVGESPYILPVETIIGFHELQAAEFIGVDQRSKLARIKNVHYPFIRLGDFVGLPQKIDGGLIVLIEALGKKIALQVDQVVGKTQVVLKPIGNGVGSTEGLGGAAVMGNGKVALIIDVAGLALLSETSLSS